LPGLASFAERANVAAMQRGRFITIEGGEGTGKSTQIARLAAWLEPRVGEVIRTREPGGSPGAEAIRALLVNGPPEKWSAQTETLLMFAARRDHIERVIEPALSRGAWVICDRFTDSTRAYQGVAGGADPALIRALEDHVVGPMTPDLTLILDLPTEIGLERAGARGEGEGRFEAKGAEFHANLRQAFLAIALAEAERCAVVDAAGTPDAVTARLTGVVAARLDP
jgi:dTMP kinase